MDINVEVRGGAHGTTYFDREITKAQYERARGNRDYLTKEDACRVLTDAEKYGYGAATNKVFEQGGKYYVHCYRYNSCD